MTRPAGAEDEDVVLFLLVALLVLPGGFAMNRLAGETSPYLRQHADNPVDWYPWGEEAFARARRENKPIFLSIGYATCYWCHVMEEESFEDPETAEILNRYFVSIKVDREERPDIDQLYMRAYQKMSGGAGGWPLNLFLTPEGKPFYGGTYFPKERRGGWPAFREVLLAVARAWAEREEELRAQAERLAPARILAQAPGGRPEGLERLALEALAFEFDPQHGGFGVEPKFPQAPLLGFLLRLAWLGDREAWGMLGPALLAMAEGGIYDQLGGGFHRYAVDAAWRVPHFEKMLYDNAQLARVYLGAWRISGEPRFRRVAEETLDFLLAELAAPEGGFYSALDAGRPGAEGAYYVWTWEEWRQVLGAEAEAAARAYGVRPEGNWEKGKNVLWRRGEPPKGVRERLLAARARRPRPGLDDKILADWNGLALAAFAEAGRLLEEPRYLEAARRTARFLLERMYKDGRIRHSWARGRLRPEAYLADQAAVGLGLLELHHATGELRWLEAARALGEVAMRYFEEENRRFVDALEPTPLGRPADPTDGAYPSGSSLAIELLLRLAAIYGESRWEEAARSALDRLGPGLEQSPGAFGAALSAHLFDRRGSELAVSTPAELAAFARRIYAPLTVFVFGPEDALPVLRRRPEGRAYLCRRAICRLPSTDADQLIGEFRAFYPEAVLPD